MVGIAPAMMTLRLYFDKPDNLFDNLFDRWVLDSTELAWASAVANQNSQAMLTCFSESAESHLSLRASGKNHPPRKLRGRGKLNLVPLTIQPPHADDEGVVDTRMRCLCKLTRRTEELVRKCTHRYVLAPIPAEWHDLWNKLPG